jgi:hypothetical protein
MSEQSPSKVFKPSRAIRIEPKRATDGTETWEVTITDEALERLARAAGVAMEDLEVLRDPMMFMMFSLQRLRCDRSPSRPQQIKHLKATLSAAREVETLLQAEWFRTEMRRFEDGEILQQLFGQRYGIHAKTQADVEKLRRWNRALPELQERVVQEVLAISRICTRLVKMLKLLGVPPSPEAQYHPTIPPAQNEAKQYIADSALLWWTKVLKHEDEKTKKFIAFAGALYQLAGFAMKAPAIREQLKTAVRRRDAQAAQSRRRR